MAYNSNSLTRLSNTIASVEDIDFIESDEASHTFSNLQPNSTYTVYSYTVDENNIKSNMYSTEITTDEYELPTVDSVSHSVTLNSITVNVTASGGSNSVSTYLYKIGDEEWIETESSSYTFNNLLDTTEYNIRIKVKDTDGHESTEYYEAITTEVYILPVVTSVKTETTWSSITLTPSGTNGTNTIDHYEYSIDDGDYQISNVFNNLADNHEYTIHVKAIDTAGRKSNVYTLQVTTDKYKLPTIDNVETSSTAEAITVSIDATGIDGNIVSYHYSRDDGSNYTDTPSNSYTFTNLSPNTTFYLKVYVTDSNGRVSGEYAIVTNTLNHDVTLASNNQNNIYNPSTPATLNCNGATSSYNQKYQRVEISQINNQYTNCVLTYQTPNSKNYLNNYIIGLEGTTQGSGKVLNEISVIPDYENAISISKSDYKNVTMFHNSSYSSSTGTSNSNTYTFDGNKWTSVPNNMTELNVSSYYHINFRVQTSGYYKLCYTISEGYIIDDLYVYMGSEQVFNENPSSSNSKSGCIILNYVDTNTDIRIALNTWDEPLPTITFNLQKAPNIENVNVGYRYEGKNPNNYIWFNNEMWRIIGVFDEDSHGVSGQNLVKIIRANSIGELTWDKSNINSWTNSSLMNLLNGAYLNSQNGTGGEYCYGESDYSINCDYSLIGINDAYRPMIKEVNWKLGGYYNYDSLYNPPSVFYKNERGKNSYENAPTSWSGKIGLIYPSDYGYSILNDYCERTSNLTGYNNENCAGQSWLYGKGSMWTITPDSSNSNDVFTIGDGGTSSRADTNGRSNVNPTLYLDSNVYIIGGNGTESNPYIIGI